MLQSLCPGLEARSPARRREERGCGPVTGKDRASCQSGGQFWEYSLVIFIKGYGKVDSDRPLQCLIASGVVQGELVCPVHPPVLFYNA